MDLQKSWFEKLPINRKEVFYTATLLPQIICADGFTHIGKFLDLAGVAGHLHVDNYTGRNVRVISEYNLSTSLRGDQNSRLQVPALSHTPDLTVLIAAPPPLVLVIEGKMFERPMPGQLVKQLRSQHEHFIMPIRGWLGASQEVVHVALLPKAVADRIHQGSRFAVPAAVRVMTWEAVADSFRPIPAALPFVELLDAALIQWQTLVSKSRSGGNADDALTGAEILSNCCALDWPYRNMGRRGGPEGRLLSEDLASGRWRTRRYEVNGLSRPENVNWFRIAHFIRKLRSHGVDIDVLRPSYPDV